MKKFFAFLSASLLIAALFSCNQSDPNAVKAPETGTANTQNAEVDSLGRPLAKPNPWLGAPCDLIADEDFRRVLNVDDKRDFANKHTLNGQAYCMRTWKKTDWREREAAALKNSNLATNPESMLVVEVINYRTNAVAKAQYEMTARDKIGGFTEAVPELGQGALWSNDQTVLYVVKDHLCLKIKLDHADQPHDNLPKAIELAQIALAKM